MSTFKVKCSCLKKSDQENTTYLETYDLFKEEVTASCVGREEKCLQKFSGEMY
jgi:hypothetical protein